MIWGHDNVRLAVTSENAQAEKHRHGNVKVTGVDHKEVLAYLNEKANSILEDAYKVGGNVVVSIRVTNADRSDGFIKSVKVVGKLVWEYKKQ